MSEEKFQKPSDSDGLGGEFEPDLRDPVQDTLHRGLKARHISMIAVRSLAFLALSSILLWGLIPFCSLEVQ